MRKDLDSYILTRQELQIMKTVWHLGSATVKDVCSAKPFNKTTPYSTILTFMRILEKKDVLTHTESGRTYVYTPLLTREQAIRNQIHHLIDSYFDGNTVNLIEVLLSNEIDANLQQEEIFEILKSLKSKKIA